MRLRFFEQDGNFYHQLFSKTFDYKQINSRLCSPIMSKLIS